MSPPLVRDGFFAVLVDTEAGELAAEDTVEDGAVGDDEEGGEEAEDDTAEAEVTEDRELAGGFTGARGVWEVALVLLTGTRSGAAARGEAAAVALSTELSLMRGGLGGCWLP